jgi:Flp pilus assembly protein TadB
MSMSILAIIIAGLVFIGGLLVIYGDRKIPALSEAELRGNLQQLHHLLDLQLYEPRPWGQTIRKLLNHAGLYQVTVSEFVIFSVANGIVVFLAVYFLLPGILMALAMAAGGLCIPWLYVGILKSRHQTILDTQLEQALDILIHAMQIMGKSRQDAFRRLVRVMDQPASQQADTGADRMEIRPVLPPPLGPAFVLMFWEMQRGGVGLVTAVKHLAERMENPSVDLVVNTVCASDEAKLGALLTALRDSIHGRRIQRAAVQAAFTMTVSQMYVVTGLCGGFLIFWRFFSPENMALLMGSLLGQVILILAFGYLLLGNYIVHRQGALENILGRISV